MENTSFSYGDFLLETYFDGTRPSRINRLRALVLIIVSLIICTLAYYSGELIELMGWTNLRWSIFYTVHDLHRMLFLVPIISSACWFRTKGTVTVTIMTFLILLPRALFISPYPDPLLRIVLFIVPAGLVGILTSAIINGREQQSKLKELARNERDRFIGILEKVGDGVCIIGPDYRIRYVNPVMLKEFGDGIGLFCYKYLHQYDKPCTETCRLPDILCGSTMQWEYNFPDGRTFETIASPLRDMDGKICQMTTLRNITQRKRVEFELMGLSKLKSDILSNLSHELRSPLTSMKGIVSSLLQKDVVFDPETHNMLLEGVLKETNRMEKLVTNLLDISKLEAGVWKPSLKPCVVQDIVNETLERFKWIHPEHIFKTEVEADLPEISADFGQIRQVLNNLLDNAAAFSDEGTTITVRAIKVNDFVELSISDQGPGIPVEDCGRIFEKFYQGAQKRRRHGGVGLGLAICQSIVVSHGGRIWAESKAGQGSTFYFTLPVLQSDNGLDR